MRCTAGAVSRRWRRWSGCPGLRFQLGLAIQGDITDAETVAQVLDAFWQGDEARLANIVVCDWHVVVQAQLLLAALSITTRWSDVGACSPPTSCSAPPRGRAQA